MKALLLWYYNGMNPFKPDTIVYEDDFIGRDEELKELEQRINNSKTARILVMAPRRYGKTSLLKNLIYKLRKSKKQSNFCVYLDIFDCASTDDFANRLVESIVNAPGYDSFKKNPTG